VMSRQDGIDPVGSCIGMRGNRIQSIVNELQGEKIDVVRWDPNPKVFLANALSPSEVVHVELHEETGNALAVVPERQLSLAIGKEGQNARLAAKLTNCRLDIKSMSEWELIRSQRQVAEEHKPAGEEAVMAVEEPEAEAAVLEAEAVVAEAQAQAAEATTAEAEAVIAAGVEAVEAGDAPAAETEEAEAVPSNKLTAEEELALLALEEAEAATAAEPEEDEGEGEEFDNSVFIVPVPATGPGLIRFAEDIMEDFRGPGRRGRRRGGGASVARGRRGPPSKSRGGPGPRPPAAGAGT
jgi:N utilization substance protein A